MDSTSLQRLDSHCRSEPTCCQLGRTQEDRFSQFRFDAEARKLELSNILQLPDKN